MRVPTWHSHSAIKRSTPKIREANYEKIAISPGEGEIRSTMDIQWASTVSINKYIGIYPHAYILYGGGRLRRMGGTKLYGKMNSRYKKVH